MRNRLVLISCFSAVVAFAQAAPRPLSAGPSCTGWSTQGELEMLGRTTGGGLDGVIRRVVDPRTGRWAEWTDYGGFQVASGFDGVTAWSRDRSGGSHRLNAAFAVELARSESWIARRGWCRAAGADITPTGHRTDMGHSYSVYRVVPKGGAPIDLWIDAASGFPYRVVEQQAESHLVRTWSDWRRFPGGVRVARVERVEYPEDEAAETLTFAKIAPARGEAFAIPAPPRDFEILGAAQSTTVPYEADVDRVFVPVSVDGHGPFLFEFDTGGHLILTSDAAAGLGLKPMGAFSSTGGGQAVIKAGFVQVHEIRIGDAVIRDQPVKVLPLSSNERGPRLPRAGILGLELLERFAVHLDRRGHTMTLTPLARFRHSGPGTPLPLAFMEDAPLTAGAFEGESGNFELDTGNSGPAIVEGLWATKHGFADRLSHGAAAIGNGVGGSYSEVTSRAALALGPFSLPNELVSYVGIAARGSESVQDLAGNLGEPVLSQFDVTFDYARQTVWLAPLPDRSPRAFTRLGAGLAKEKSDRFDVVFVVAGSPAERAGLKAGDAITAIDGRPATAMAVFDARRVFLQPAGTTVMLTLTGAAGTSREMPIVLQDFLP